MNQISELTSNLDDNRDKEVIRGLKKDNEELKLRFLLNLLYRIFFSELTQRI